MKGAAPIFCNELQGGVKNPYEEAPCPAHDLNFHPDNGGAI